MSPPDFFLFPKIKNTLKGHRFQDIETIKQNLTQQLQAIPKSEFQKGFEDWKHRWAKIVESKLSGISNALATSIFLSPSSTDSICFSEIVKHLYLLKEDMSFLSRDKSTLR
ncbi:hypothetical protein TNCV_837261 [Trichonephila clavipes]|nr:hypothetical protein TNCV_837261 [Trichonephila clavipes]